MQPIRTLYQDLLFYDKNHKHKKVPHHHLPPTLSRPSVIPRHLIMAQQKRGFKFALSKIESLLKVVEAIIPIGNPDWDKILNEHASRYPTKDCTAKSLKHKFQELACTKIPAGDPNMPPHICKAKHIYYRIVQVTDRSTGGSEDGADLNYERDSEFEADEEDDDEKGGMVEVNNNSFTLSADNKQLTMEDDNGSQIDAAAAVAAASGRQASDG
jgi:hypothetical protein